MTKKHGSIARLSKTKSTSDSFLIGDSANEDDCLILINNEKPNETTIRNIVIKRRNLKENECRIDRAIIGPRVVPRLVAIPK